MTDDLVRELREEAECYRGKTQACLTDAADRIERLEAALHEIGAMNALRDRWSDPIENVIRAALEGNNGEAV